MSRRALTAGLLAASLSACEVGVSTGPGADRRLDFRDCMQLAQGLTQSQDATSIIRACESYAEKSLAKEVQP